MGTAIAKVQKENIPVHLPIINEAEFGFKPDTINDRIIFGLKGINSINTELAQLIIENRPYKSIEDFAERMLDTGLIKKAQMIQLIKGGCFTELHSKDRAKTMEWYIKKYIVSDCDSLTLSQLAKVVEMNIIPDEILLSYKMVNFKKYVLDDQSLIDKYIDPNKKMVKRGYHDGRYVLDNNSQPFFKEHFTEESIVDVRGEYFVLSEKLFTKEVDKYIQPLRDWFNMPETLDLYNEKLFELEWNKYAGGSISHWNMQALTYYEIGENELENINEDKYGIVNYFDLPEEPEPYSYYTRYINGEPKQIPKFKISCIAGAVINSDNQHHTVTISTKYGPVNVKINKGKYAFYNKRISEMGEDGKKHVIEESWFKRGTLLRFCGIKRDDQFWPMNYSDTIYSHTVNQISAVNADGSLDLKYERYSGEEN